MYLNLFFSVLYSFKFFIYYSVLVGEPKPDVYWLKKNTNNSEIFTNTLEIEYAKEEHEGNYVCVAKNSLGDDKHEFEIIINRMFVHK